MASQPKKYNLRSTVCSRSLSFIQITTPAVPEETLTLHDHIDDYPFFFEGRTRGNRTGSS